MDRIKDITKSLNYGNLAVIPARAGSKGLVGKNVAPLCGKPLIAWTLEVVKKVKFFDKIVVTTDCPKVKDICKSYNIEVIDRPARLCDDDTPLAPVVKHALNEMELRDIRRYGNIFTIQPTSPLRTVEDIKEAFSIYTTKRVPSLLSVVEERHSIWKQGSKGVETVRSTTINRQQMKPYYIGNGAIFISKRRVIQNGSRLSARKALYPMSFINSIDVHTEEDLELAQFYIQDRLGRNGGSYENLGKGD